MTFGIETSPGNSSFYRRPWHPPQHRLLIVSNRLPATVHFGGDGIRVSPSSGGVASGLRSVHSREAGLWIGWSGVAAELEASHQGEIAMRLSRLGTRSVPMTGAEIEGFYRCFANSVLWPLLHGERPAPAASWSMYQRVNARFADVVLRHWLPGDRIWIHDYHLMLLPRLLRERCPDARIGFFLHTPFPDLETLATLRSAPDLIDGVLGADSVGFQTRADVERFALAVSGFSGRRPRLASGLGQVDDGERPVRLHFSPMSVDVAGFAARGADPELERRIATLRAPGVPLFVSVDRLDPTQGIPERLEAFRLLLEMRPELRGRARLYQVAVPSREEVSAHSELRSLVGSKVAALNARFRTATWQPIELVHGHIDDLELAALYRAADVMLVTSRRDGTNLVAKEFVATRVDGEGVLILSRHAGASAELAGAVLVDPGEPAALTSAYRTALDVSPVERRHRMACLRSSVGAHDVGHWARECLAQLDSSVPARLDAPGRRTG